MTGRPPAGAGADPYYGHGSAQRLESWLDQQVITERISPAQAEVMLPGYQPPDLEGCLRLIPEPATDEDGDDLSFGPC